MKHSKRSLILQVLLLCCLIPLACQKVGPKTALDATSQARAKDALEATQRNYAITSLNAFTQVRVKAKGKNRSFDAALLVQAPDQVRLEIMDDLGQVLTRIVCDGAQILYYEPKENAYALLPNDATAFQKILKLPISPREFVDRLLLKIPGEEILNINFDGIASIDSTIAPTERFETANYKFELEPSNHRLLNFARRQKSLGKSDRYQIFYQDYPSLLPDYPRQITWRFLKPKIEIMLSLQHVAFPDHIAFEKFSTAPPLGAEPGKIR